MAVDDPQSLTLKIRAVSKEFGRLKKLVTATSGKQLWSVRAKSEMRDCVLKYFREIRGPLTTLMVETGELDAGMQELFNLTDKDGMLTTYKEVLARLESDLHAVELAAELRKSNVQPSLAVKISETESRIVATLQELAPATALSYRQVLRDISDSSRVSFRGTAAELREVLRETLDQLAPDDQVAAEDGFKLEKDRVKPTMRQKARFILVSRGKASGTIDAPIKTIGVVEEIVSGLVRSTYDRGSVESHTASGISKPSLLQLKMYTDSVLCELLEIHEL